MNISVQSTGTTNGTGVRRVSLLGRLDRPEEATELCRLLAGPDSQPLDISCFDADTLPADVIEAIAAALDRGVDVKVRAYRPLLAHGLSRLSLPVLPVPPSPPRALLERCRAVALAGSANSLDKILAIVGALPESNAAIFIAQHVQEDQPNLLDRLLEVLTDYTVLMPQNLMAIKPHTIYVAPPGHHMKVAHGLVYLTRDRKISYARPSIDVLFESLAAEYGADALVALLCGYGQDGLAGCAAVHAAGGCVLVEDGSECEGAGMLPDSAISAGHFDHLLKHRAIASIVAAAVSPRSRTAEGPLLDLFLGAVHEHTGYDFRSYQHGTLERRIANLIRSSGFISFFDFQRAALSNPQVTQRLLTELSINVTEFFRHPEQFLRLRQEVLSYLASFPLIKVWSAGCATGEEAYSLAMLLDELGLLEKSRIFATDINPYLLELAQAGLFPREGLEKSRNNHAEAGYTDFARHIEDHGRYLKVAERYRERVLFHHHALGQDGVFNEFQLIICRNVMIYFSPAMQRRVFGLFAQSLHREGFLVLGPSDGLKWLAQECQFKPVAGGENIYRCTGSTP
ncbi:MAG: chemotaxis protein CheB [Sterolibacterium sp.]|nr:chemotaxis protein CheB [Sterolibacterium sp.]